MAKKKEEIHFEIEALDLHRVKHADVAMRLETYVFCNQDDIPLQIITGNSPQMRRIVIEWLTENGFSYKVGDNRNKGYIVVLD